MNGPDTATERVVRRATPLLSRPGAWISPEQDGYRVRVGEDRRRRSPLALDEAAFQRLAQAPGLIRRAEGGWRLATPVRAEPDRAGRPGVLEGERVVMDADGRAAVRTANLSESPLAWLARRRDAGGRPWLSPAELAAGERLRDDYNRAGVLGAFDDELGRRASERRRTGAGHGSAGARRRGAGAGGGGAAGGRARAARGAGAGVPARDEPDPGGT